LVPIALYLNPGASSDQLGDLFPIEAQELSGQLAEPFQIVIFDVVLVAFCEAVDKHGSRLHSINDDRPKTAGPSLSWPWNPLFDDATTEIGVD
jgi:hypothetical protein